MMRSWPFSLKRVTFSMRRVMALSAFSKGWSMPTQRRRLLRRFNHCELLTNLAASMIISSPPRVTSLQVFKDVLSSIISLQLNSWPLLQPPSQQRIAQRLKVKTDLPITLSDVRMASLNILVKEWLPSLLMIARSIISKMASIID
jgi:hypothetical protein